MTVEFESIRARKRAALIAAPVPNYVSRLLDHKARAKGLLACVHATCDLDNEPHGSQN